MHSLSFATIFALSLSSGVSAAPTQGNYLASIASAAQNLKKLIQVDPQGVSKTWVGQDPCKYTGFFCETAPNGIPAVASIDFNGFHLGGRDLAIGNFLAPQTELALLHLNTNGFKGAFPSLDAKKYPYIYEIDVSNNQLSGPFPNLFRLDLTYLDLRFNQFSGNLPEEAFTSWKDIQVLFLNDNQFTGSIPNDLASFSGSYLTLANNKFTGPVPGSIGSARYLYEILLLGNKLSGPLPSEIGASKSLNLLDVSNNLLTGPIPTSYGGLTNATDLNFAGNSLTGGIPESVCKLPQIQTLNVSSNALTQALGPACVRLFKAKALIVDDNCIPGLPRQRPTAQCSSR